MRLIECYINSFGKLRNYSYKFNQGLNVIQHENGYGKTTLTFFLKAMFYGLNDKRKILSTNERLKYRPWLSTKKFGGYLIFEKDGKNYKIERFFGNKSSDDTNLLTDLETGKTYNYEKPIGNSVFKVDEEGFLSTLFLSQNDFETTGNSSLTARYNSEYQQENPFDFEKSLERVSDKLKEYKKTGDRGLISDTKRKINEVDQAILSAKSSEDILVSLNNNEKKITEKINFLNSEIKDLEQSYDDTLKQEAEVMKQRQRKELADELDSINKQIDQNLKKLNYKNVSIEQLATFKECLKEFKDCKTKKQILLEDVDKYSTYSTNNKDNKKKGLISFVLVACVMAVAFGLLSFSLPVVGIPMLVAVIVCAIILPLTVFAKKNKDSYKFIDDKKKQLVEIDGIISTYSQSLNTFVTSFNLSDLDYENAIVEIENALNSIKSFNERKNFLLDKIKEFPADETVFLLPNIDLELLKRQMHEKKNELEDLSKERSNLWSRIKGLEVESNNLSFLESERGELESQLNEYNENYKILKQTQEFLKMADDNLKTRYKKPLKDAYNKYLSLLVDENASADIDVNFKVSVNEGGFSADTEYYSKGYQNLYEICKRFAMIEVLFGKEKPFIVLDDPFSNLDKEKIELAKKLTNSLSRQYQIIYFTCHSSRVIDA